jgi:SPP1 family predicted phage head-tail adaptor
VIPVMNIGAMPHRGTIQSPDDDEDGIGGVTRVWVDEAANVCMGIKPLSGDERLYGMQLQTRITHEITMRYRAGLTTEMRILHKGIPYNIRYIGDQDMRSKKFVLLAEQGVAS